MKHKAAGYYYLIFIFCWFIPSALIAQNNNYRHRLFYKSKAQLRNVASGGNISGDPYFNDVWEKGRLLLKSGKVSREIDLKYQIFNNILVFKRNNERKVVKQQSINGFILNHRGQKVLFKNGFKALQLNITPTDLVQIIYRGKLQLLKKYEVEFRKGGQPNPRTGKIESYFRKKTTYFLIDTHGHYHKINLDKKNILPFLEPHKAQIKNFTYARNLSFHKVNDVRKILYEYDLMEKNDRQ